MITPYAFDQNLLLAMNFDGGAVLDQIMFVISGKLTWVPLYAYILWIIYKREGLRRLIFFGITIALLITCADQTATLAKEHLSKFRPTHYPPIMDQVHTVNGYMGGLYGTISSHAANSFAVAMISSLLIRRRWFAWMMFSWAAVVAYSRIYLGVHYPMDIVIGAVEGLLWGWLWYIFMTFAERQYSKIVVTLRPLRDKKKNN